MGNIIILRDVRVYINSKRVPYQEVVPNKLVTLYGKTIHGKPYFNDGYIKAGYFYPDTVIDQIKFENVKKIKILSEAEIKENSGFEFNFCFAKIGNDKGVISNIGQLRYELDCNESNDDIIIIGFVQYAAHQKMPTAFVFQKFNGDLLEDISGNSYRVTGNAKLTPNRNSL